MDEDIKLLREIMGRIAEFSKIQNPDFLKEYDRIIAQMDELDELRKEKE